MQLDDDDDDPDGSDADDDDDTDTRVEDGDPHIYTSRLGFFYFFL